MSQASFRHMSVAELAEQLRGDAPVVVVDIRDPQSFDSGHINGALRLHDGNAAQFVADSDKSARTVVCCYHGHSSQGAAAWLAEQGFADVWSLDGGATEWAHSQPVLSE